MAILNVSGLPALSIQNAVLPPEGPKAVPLFINFATTALWSLNVRDLYNKGPSFPGLSAVQTLFVDNSGNDEQLTVTLTGTGQTVKVGPGLQGYYPVLCPTTGEITFTTAGTVTVPVIIVNVPISAAQWGQTGFGNYDQAGDMLVKDTSLDALIIDGALQVNKISG